MNDSEEAYPLLWPFTWTRTPTALRESARFSPKTIAIARGEVLHELELLGAETIVISSNIQLRKDGFPRSGYKNPSDPGIAIYFTLLKKRLVLACDKWILAVDNIWAIAKHINALRGQERWGVGTWEQAFAGYQALPTSVEEEHLFWWEVLGVQRFTDIKNIQYAYKLKLFKVHPDYGGNIDEFEKLQKAFAMAKAEKGF